MTTPSIPNLLSLTAGAFLASGISGVILLARDEPVPKQKIPISCRNANGASSQSGKTLENETLVAHYQRVGSTSQSLLNRLELEKRLDEIPFAEIGNFIVESKDQLTRAQRAKAYTHLLVRWAKEDPEAAINCLLELNVESLVQPLASSPYLTGQICEQWLEKDQDQFQRWLSNSWGEGAITLNPFQDNLGSRSTYQEMMGMHLVEKLKSDEGFETALEVLKKLPAHAYSSLMPSLWNTYGRHGGPVPKERIAPLYELFHKIPAGPERAQAGSFVWQSWMKTDPQGAEETLATLAPPEELEARLALIPKPGGFAVKVKSDAEFEIGEKVYQPESLAEEVAIQTAIQQGLNASEALALVARQRLATEDANNGHFFQWLGQFGTSLNIDQDLLEAGQRLIPNPEIKSSKGDYRGAIILGSYIKDPQVRQDASEQIYRDYLKHHPAEADDLLAFNHFSTGFVAELKQTRDEKGQ